MTSDQQPSDQSTDDAGVVAPPAPPPTQPPSQPRPSSNGGFGAVIATFVVITVGVVAAFLVARADNDDAAADCVTPKAISVCANRDDEAANTGATEISMGEVADLVSIISKSESAQTFFAQYYTSSDGSPVPVLDEVTGDVNVQFESKFFEERIYLALVREEFDKLGYEITEEDRTSSAAQIDGYLTQSSIIPDSFPSEVYQLLVDDLTYITAFNRIFNAAREAELQAAYDASPEDFVGTCISHILITPENDPATGVATPEAEAAALAEATAVKARLAAGEDFATVANEVSDDGSPGGDLGCLPDEQIATTFVPEFATPIPSLAVGVVSDPVKSSFGYHLILVTSRGQLSFEDSQSLLAELVPETNNLTALIQERSLSGDVTVNEKFGTWDTSGSFGTLKPVDDGSTPSASLVTQ